MFFEEYKVHSNTYETFSVVEKEQYYVHVTVSVTVLVRYRCIYMYGQIIHPETLIL